jgi:hypothetical protein
MKRIDRTALKLAIQQTLAAGGVEAEQIRNKLARESWEEVAQFAAYSRQCVTLRLRPWEAPPAHTYDEGRDPEDYGGRPKELALLRRMLRAGVSRWHPNPPAALAEAEAKAMVTEEG